MIEQLREEYLVRGINLSLLYFRFVNDSRVLSNNFVIRLGEGIDFLGDRDLSWDIIGFKYRFIEFTVMSI